MMRRGLVVVVSSALIAACGPAEEGELSQLVASKREAVVGGRLTFGDPEIFWTFTAGFVCSATLIGRRTLLTAAHCLTEDSSTRPLPPTGVVTNLTNASLARSFTRHAAYRIHPQYVPIVYDASDRLVSKSANDIAMIRLETEPPAPVKPWNRDPLTPDLASTTIRVVGYGITNKGMNDDGLKRSGETIINEIGGTTFGYGVSSKSGACQGDSGGPALRVFPDGSDRVIGVTSYDRGACGNNTDTRVDAFTAWIQGGLDSFESSCAADGRCKAGCTPVDPDCACVADAQCTASCTAPSIDPDCASTCGFDGVCSTLTAGCGSDPDCWPLGSTCGYEAHCASRLCVTSAQHTQPYCSKACAGPADCPTTMNCVANQCQYKIKPTAAEGQACTPGTTYCDGTSLICAGWEQKPATVCSRACYEDGDCDGDSTCRRSPQGSGVCVPNVIFGVTGNETLRPALGCTSAPGLGLAGLLALSALRRRRPPRR